MLYYLIRAMRKLNIPAVKRSYVHRTAKICSGSQFVFSKIDRYSYVGSNSIVQNATIGAFCSIADGVIIGGSNHPVEWGSTSPVFVAGRNILSKNFSFHHFIETIGTEIGSDVWVGNNVLIKSGVKIGHGAIIGMGSVVTKSIPDYEIWAGNPARFIRKRFHQDTIDKLLYLKWWELSDSEIKAFSRDINKVDVFVQSLMEKL